MNKILFVLTNHSDLGNTGEKTGFYLSELTHPWEVLTSSGYEVDFVSPNGGLCPIDGYDLNDPINKKFVESSDFAKTKNTINPSEINPKDYVAIHFVGGHGTMWDFPDNISLQNITSQIYENGGVVSAVCHGPSGLVNVKLSNGQYLVSGKKVNSFTNEEEKERKLDNIVPFLLESKLIERGGIFEKSANWQEHVTIDQRLITGQNPASAKKLGEEVLKIIKN